MFLSDYEYEETTIETKVSELIFKTTGKVPVKQGWKKILKQTRIPRSARKGYCFT